METHKHATAATLPADALRNLAGVQKPYSIKPKLPSERRGARCCESDGAWSERRNARDTSRLSNLLQRFLQMESTSWVLRSIRQEMLLAVTPLRRLGSDEILGTGFFYALHEKKYLVTCYHVLRTGLMTTQPQEWTATLHLSGEPGKERSAVVLKKQAATVRFRVPDDVLYCPDTDLCAVEVHEKIRWLGEEVIFRTVDPSRLLDPLHHPWLDIGRDIFLVGYPEGLSDTYHHLPLVRTGHIAFDPSLGWDGDEYLGMANLAVYSGDSGAPLFWQGPALQVNQKPGEPPQVAAVEDLKLIGVHCGGYYGHHQQEKGTPIAFGVYVKVALLAKGFATWKPMETLRSTEFEHPHRSTSNHHLHVSGQFPRATSDAQLQASPPAQQLGMSEPTILDKQLRMLLSAPSTGRVVLVQKNAGRRWTCSFDREVLQSLSVGERVFERTNSVEFGGAIDVPVIRFYSQQTPKTFDGIFLFRVYPKDERLDGVVLSGIICEDMELNEELPMQETVIAWTLL